MTDDLSLDHQTIADQLATSGAWGAFLVIDTETTGLDPHEDRIVEIAAVLFEAGAIVERFSTRVNPGRTIPAEATAVHGISDADVADAPTFAEAWLLVCKMAESAILTCAYSQKFDRDFCRAELVRAELPQPPLALRKPWLDPLVFIRHFDKYAKGSGRHKLSATCERRKVALVKAHAAEDDAVAAGLLWLAMEPELRAAWKAVSPLNVLRIQMKLAEDQEREREEYLRRLIGQGLVAFFEGLRALDAAERAA
jgi:DNA polymerase III epsilon subunit-like protein